METETHDFAVNGGFIVHNCDAIRYWTASRPRGGKETLPDKYAINSIEYRVQKNLDSLIKKKRRATNW
jgi:hypothetical protein